MYKIKHYLRHENKMNENKVLSYCEALRCEKKSWWKKWLRVWTSIECFGYEVLVLILTLKYTKVIVLVLMHNYSTHTHTKQSSPTCTQVPFVYSHCVFNSKCPWRQVVKLCPSAMSVPRKISQVSEKSFSVWGSKSISQEHWASGCVTPPRRNPVCSVPWTRERVLVIGMPTFSRWQRKYVPRDLRAPAWWPAQRWGKWCFQNGRHTQGDSGRRKVSIYPAIGLFCVLIMESKEDTALW